MIKNIRYFQLIIILKMDFQLQIYRMRQEDLTIEMYSIK